MPNPDVSARMRTGRACSYGQFQTCHYALYIWNDFIMSAIVISPDELGPMPFRMNFHVSKPDEASAQAFE